MDMEEWVQQSTYVYIIVVCGMRFGFIRLYQVSFMSETGLNGAPLNQKKLTENVQFAFANARCVWWAGKIRHTTSLGPPPCKRPASLVLVVLPHVFIQYSCHPQYNIHWPTYGTASEPIWLHLKIRGPDQPPKPTGDPDPRSRPAIQTDPDLTIQTYDPDLLLHFVWVCWSRPLVLFWSEHVGSCPIPSLMAGLWPWRTCCPAACCG